jgi:hypothetical protein
MTVQILAEPNCNCLEFFSITQQFNISFQFGSETINKKRVLDQVSLNDGQKVQCYLHLKLSYPHSQTWEIPEILWYERIE